MAEIADDSTKTFVIDTEDGAAETKVEKAAEGQESKAVDTKAADDPDAGLDEMRRRVEEATEARKRAEAATIAAQEQAQRRLAAQQQAERLAAQRAAEVQQVRRTADDAELAAITNALQNAEKTRDALQVQQAALNADSNWADAAKVNAEIGEVAARIVALKDGKLAAERRAQQQQRESEQQYQQQQQQQQYQPDPRTQQDDWLAQQDPYNAAWIRQHRDRFFADTDFQRKAVAASGYAINNKGLKVGSVEYYQFIDEAVGLRQAEQPKQQQQQQQRQEQNAQPDARSAASQTQSRQSPVAAAPPSRTATPSGGGKQQVEITLTAAERAHARATLTPDIIGKDKDPEAVFAAHKAKLMAEGRWSGESFNH